LRRNGLDLPGDKQTELRAINDELSKLSQNFGSNISDAVLSIRVKPERLKGLPQSFLDSHKAEADGLVTLTTNYPDYFPVITYAEDRSVARELTALFDNRAADKNLPILDRILELRSKKAKLLGYATWADYAIEPRMAKSSSTVREFLTNLAKDVKAPARREYKEFEAKYRKHGGKAGQAIPNYERVYLEQKLREKNYGFDAKQLSEYFEMNAVTQGLLLIVQKLYGIEFRDVADAPKWHPDVRVLDVFDHAKRLGRIYLDLYPREGKYKHAAMFEIRGGKKLENGKYLEPITALVCNFPKPGDTPALMTHSDVTTYFHEFGHTLHHVLTQQELSSYAGTNTARDFVEAPSQMFEEWSYRRETLDLFAKHYQTGKPIPENLFQAMSKSRGFGRALSTERQISLATLDFEYHVRPWPLSTDTVFQEVMAKTQSFTYLPNTHFQATFGHLMGYDAGYYSYQWALAIARDVLTRFEKDGFMNEKTASDWRKAVLEQGAGEDENKLIEAFLGRPHDLKAYIAYLQNK
jgi:thimet oligopeptidase